MHGNVFIKPSQALHRSVKNKNLKKILKAMGLISDLELKS